MKKVILLSAVIFAISIHAQDGKRHRSAETGRFVSKSTASKNPSTTVSESRSSSKSSKR